MKILVFGSANIDYSMRMDHIVVPGETQPCVSLVKSAGGKGANQAYAIAQAGAKLYFAGKVGKDGKFILDKLSSAGVDVGYVLDAPNGTGSAFIQVDRNGQNSIVVYGGGNLEIDKNDVDSVLSNFSEGDVLVLNGEIGQLEYIFDSACSKGMKVFINPSPINDSVKRLDLRKAAVLFFNEIEGAFFAGHSAPFDQILDELMIKYPGSEIVLTVGSEGAFHGCNGNVLFVPAIKTDVIDTTGAGDTFMGFFIAKRCEGASVKECMEIASKAASIVVSRAGAMNSIPSISEL